MLKYLDYYFTFRLGILLCFDVQLMKTIKIKKIDIVLSKHFIWQEDEISFGQQSLVGVFWLVLSEEMKLKSIAILSTSIALLLKSIALQMKIKSNALLLKSIALLVRSIAILWRSNAIEVESIAILVKSNAIEITQLWHERPLIEYLNL